MDETPRIDAAKLRDFAAASFERVGMPEADARLTADTLVQADLWGHQSHGVMRLPWYTARLQSGAARPVLRLVARLVQAGQGAVRRPGQQRALPQERLRLVKRPERPVRGQPALEGPPLAKLVKRLHKPMMTPTRSRRSPDLIACGEFPEVARVR